MKPNLPSSIKVALVHDWLNGMRGGERVLEHLTIIFPDAEIFTIHSDLSQISNQIKKSSIQSSFINKIPFKKKMYRWFLPLFPLAVKQFNFSGYDLIISTSHCAVKNISPPSNIPHICYCFSPMRYLWALQKDYMGTNVIKKNILRPVIHLLKKWDYKGAGRVTHFISISETIKDRIKKCYGRSSSLVYPPCDIKFHPIPKKENYFLVLSALVPYKKVDLAIHAANKMKIDLKIAGTGPELEKLKEISGPTIKFLGWVSEEQKKDLLSKAKALIFPGLEDFGIVPLEAMSFMTPVVGYAKGGVTETVTNKKTGLLFKDQSSTALMETLKKLEEHQFKKEDFETTLEKFSPEKFKSQMLEQITNIYNKSSTEGLGKENENQQDQI